VRRLLLDKLCFKWNFQSPLNANRERFSLMGSRSADLVKGLSSPLLCAPAWRPAHLLDYLASPRLGCLPPRHLLGTCLALAWHLLGTCLAPASGHHSLARCHLALPMYTSCLRWCSLVLVRLLGCTSYWGTHSANAPPTGGTHSASQMHLLRRSNCPREGNCRLYQCPEQHAFGKSFLYFGSTHAFYIHLHVHLRLVSMMV
jgi:hypothetical protein